MKPLFLDRSDKLNSSFSLKHKKSKNFLKVWHYHSELELVVLKKSRGTRFIGNHIAQFTEGELVLIGKNLPHMWVNDSEYFEKDSSLQAEAIVIHFKENFAGEQFWSLREMNLVHKLLEKANSGINFTGKNINNIITDIESLLKMRGFERFIRFLEILQKLAKETEYELLSSPFFIDNFEKRDKKRLKPIYNFIINNFKTGFTLEQIAKIAYMNPSSFSRYFKKVHKKTLTQYVNELRVGYACKLLTENKYSMTKICFDSGFNNLSNFNRQFKKIFACSPSEYLKKYNEGEI